LRRREEATECDKSAKGRRKNSCPLQLATNCSFVFGMWAHAESIRVSPNASRVCKVRVPCRTKVACVSRARYERSRGDVSNERDKPNERHNEKSMNECQSQRNNSKSKGLVYSINRSAQVSPCLLGWFQAQLAQAAGAACCASKPLRFQRPR
jgi:hypothetical protein